MSLYFLLGLLTVLAISPGDGRIWFEGQVLPGTNRTVGSSIPSEAEILVQRLEAGERRQVATLVSRGVGRLALQLEMALGGYGTNSLFSPVGIALALALVLLGANGATYTQIVASLGLPADVSPKAVSLLEEEFSRLFGLLGERPPADGGALFALASGVFIQNNFSVQPEYAKLAQDLYSSDVVSLDFIHDGYGSQTFINDWVQNRTDGHIKNLISHPLGFDTRVVIVSAIYFNGAWEIPFEPQWTKKQEFHVTPTSNSIVDMMVGAGDVLFHEDSERKVLGLAYKGGTTVMYFVLPTGDLDTYVATLNSTRLQDVVSSAVQTKNVIYAVPKMKLKKTVNLRDALENLGVTSLFGPEADLGKIADGLWASSVIHKVELEVNEMGTVASAATAVDLIRSGGGLVRLDRPFALFLYHVPSTIVTFWATVHDPNQTG